MFKKFLLVLALVIAALAGFMATRHSDFSVSRSVTIAAPSAVVFEQVNDLHKWEAWSPWAKKDPNAKTSYSGPGTGVDASFAWDANMEIGKGRMTITESRANELVRFRLDFEKPMEGTDNAEFAFKPDANQTVVTWTMNGTKNFVAKAVGLVMNCDKMVGDEFEKGLASMKQIIEGEAKK